MNDRGNIRGLKTVGKKCFFVFVHVFPVFYVYLFRDSIAWSVLQNVSITGDLTKFVERATVFSDSIGVRIC